jgi:triphosphoribosyl-dephospho-CoA synthase
VPIQEIKLQSLNDLYRCIALSSLLEVSGWPKPGNVHRTNDFLNTRYEHFIAGIAAIQPDFYEFCKKIYQEFSINKATFDFVNLGKLFYKASESMMDWQYGGNVILGHILILAPLVAAAVVCIKENKKSLDDFKIYLNKIIDDGTVQDTIFLYKAINQCKPGGLGRIRKYDITSKDAIEELRTDRISLKKIFELSKDYDLISREYSSGYRFSLEIGLPYFNKTFEQYHDINIAIVNTYLKLLSENEDSLVIRKSGIDAAKSVKNLAKKIVLSGGIATRKGLKRVRNFDRDLQKMKGKLNPGTTADMLTGIIFCALIFGLKF